MLSPVQLFAAPWTTACQTPLCMEFSRQEYWSGLPFPTPEDLPDPVIERESLASPALVGGFLTTSAIWATHQGIWDLIYHESAPPQHCIIVIRLLTSLVAKDIFLLVGSVCFSFFPLIVVLQVLGWPKCSFWFFHTILRKT